MRLVTHLLSCMLCVLMKHCHGMRLDAQAMSSLINMSRHSKAFLAVFAFLPTNCVVLVSIQLEFDNGCNLR